MFAMILLKPPTSAFRRLLQHFFKEMQTGVNPSRHNVEDSQTYFKDPAVQTQQDF